MIIPWDRGKIRRPGIYTGLPIETYHDDCCIGPSISSSGLRMITQRSPAHYWCQSPLNPDRLDDGKEPEHFLFGRAAHHLILGEDAFTTAFVVRPEKWDSWRTDAAKQWRQEQIDEGRTVLEPKHLDLIRYMARSLAKHPLVNAGILNGDVEQSIISKDKETGVWKKTRPDVIPNDSGDFCDVKTTSDVNYDELSYSIGKYGYHQQAALVGEAYKEVTGRPMTSFSFCFIEKDPPCSVRIVTLKECDIARGQAQNRIALRKFADCLAANDWPGPGGDQEAEFIEIPAWQQARIDRDIEFEEKVYQSKTEKAKAADYMGAG